MTDSDLYQQKCVACEGGVDAIDMATAKNLMTQLNQNWQLKENGGQIQRSFSFKNFYQTMAFVNAVAWIAHQEDHHPDMKVTYRHCVVDYTTHSIGGLSHNDFICAAKLDRLLIE